MSATPKIRSLGGLIKVLSVRMVEPMQAWAVVCRRPADRRWTMMRSRQAGVTVTKQTANRLRRLASFWSWLGASSGVGDAPARFPVNAVDLVGVFVLVG